MNEKRFYLNPSNTKYLLMGVIPSSKILNDDAPGFQFEIFVCGEKSQPLPIGGVNGLVTLCTTIRQIPEFSKIATSPMPVHPGENILISTVNFADDVNIFF